MRSPVRVLSTNNIRTANETTRELNKLNGHFPNFVHKWTKQKRSYSSEDLYLPDYLHFKGQPPNFLNPVAAVGGTRSPTVDTFCLVSRIVHRLCNNEIAVVSGGVPGVDLAAHLAAIDVVGGSTFAVLANPVESGLRGHEWSNSLVEHQFLERGGFISEYSTHCLFASEDFRERLLARDRIISGLSDLFIVFECNVDSATIDTARRAIVQGKKVICIDTANQTPRRGIAQMESDLGVEVLREAEASDEHIVEIIMSYLKDSRLDKLSHV